MESEAQRQQGNMIRFGTVAELDLAVARCRIASGDVLTDLLPWFVPRAGDTVEWSAPSVGEQVMLLCPNGDLTGAVALRGMYSDQVPPPASAAAKHLVRFKDGAQVEYDHDAHALKAMLPSGGTAEFTADGGVTINGPLTVNGDTQINGPLTVNGDTQINGDVGVSGTATAQVDVLGGGISLKNHLTTGVTTGASVSGPPQ